MKARKWAGRLSRVFLLGLAAATALSLASAAPAAAGTLDQEQTTFNAGYGMFVGSSGLAQTFTAGLSGQLDQADLALSKGGTPPDPVTVEVRSTSAGSPTSDILATGTIPTSAIGPDAVFVPVAFATPALVTAGTQYALVAYAPGLAGDWVNWNYQDAGNPYPGGQQWFSYPPIPPAADWFASTGDGDYAFKTYVSAAPPTQVTPQLTGLRAVARKHCKQVAKKRDWTKKKFKRCQRRANRLPL